MTETVTFWYYEQMSTASTKKRQLISFVVTFHTWEPLKEFEICQRNISGRNIKHDTFPRWWHYLKNVSDSVTKHTTAIVLNIVITSSEFYHAAVWSGFSLFAVSNPNDLIAESEMEK